MTAMFSPLPEPPAPPRKPTLREASDQLSSLRHEHFEKLDLAKRKGAPPDLIAAAKNRIAELEAMTPEQFLARLMVGFEAEYSAYQVAERQQRFAEFIGGVGERYAECSFDNYSVRHERHRVVFDAIRGYATDIAARVAAGNGIVLHGPNGTGKNHLLTALARFAILEHGLTVSTSPKPPLLWPADILCLCDPCPVSGLDASGGYEAANKMNELRETIGAYYDARRPIWLSANVRSREHATEMLGAQMVDRLWDGAIVIHMNWRSDRKPLVTIW